MSNHDYGEKLETAIDALRDQNAKADELSGFEHGVWTEIAIRDEQQSRAWLGWLRRAPFPSPLSAAACILVISITAGAALGLSQANAYGREASLALEERYVQSIHPVMMSENHTDSHKPH